MNRYSCIALLPFLAMTSLADAADYQGRYAIHGAGLLKCEVFVQEKGKLSPAYMMIGGWMDGYITAVNKLEKDTYDMTAYASTELLSILLDRHCKDNPNDLLAPVLDAMLMKLRKDRIKTASPLVVIRVGDFQTQLYRKTVKDLQTRLAARNLYDQKPSGAWDAGTQQALTAYQKANALNTTGFPDQKTLWHLFRSAP